MHPATVLTGVTAGDAELYHGGGLRPGLRVSAVRHDDEAVALANATEHGLTCGIITENGTHGLKVARRIRTGIVHVNDQSVADEPQAPFGGVKASRLRPLRRALGHRGVQQHPLGDPGTQHAHYPF